jgi:hypothetical protein
MNSVIFGGQMTVETVPASFLKELSMTELSYMLCLILFFFFCNSCQPEKQIKFCTAKDYWRPKNFCCHVILIGEWSDKFPFATERSREQKKFQENKEFCLWDLPVVIYGSPFSFLQFNHSQQIQPYSPSNHPDRIRGSIQTDCGV